MAVVLGIGFVLFEVKKSKQNLDIEKTGKTADNKTYKQLESYIRQTKEQGYNEGQIKQVLLKEGWSQNIVNQVFGRLR